MPSKQQGKTARQISDEIGRPVTTVKDLLRNGMPKTGKARDEWLRNHDDTARNRPKGLLAGVENPTTLELVDEKLRQEIVYRQLKNKEQSIRNDKLVGTIIEMREAEEVYGRLISMTSQNLRSVPRSVCDLLLHKDNPSEIEQIVSRAIENALEPLYQPPNDERFRQFLPESIQSVQGSRKTHRKPVGRKKPRSV